MADRPENTIDSEEDSMKGRFLTFLIGEERFGIEITYVVEIIGMQPITEMPEMPDYIRGIINLRGKIIPVLDTRLRLKKPQIEYDDRTCIIVIVFHGISMGLIVDRVSEVLPIPEDDIAEKPKISCRESRGYIKSIGKVGEHVILLIDCDKLLNDEEFDAVSAQL
ncbi:MAG: chemotaxis protein CheW [Intestinimonas sp.]|jgi:purine-binding chemotaxis protein CheW|nr:chemotaxis protein CheW [Intestinimonas sp.]